MHGWDDRLALYPKAGWNRRQRPSQVGSRESLTTRYRKAHPEFHISFQYSKQEVQQVRVSQTLDANDHFPPDQSWPLTQELTDQYETATKRLSNEQNQAFGWSQAADVGSSSAVPGTRSSKLWRKSRTHDCVEILLSNHRHMRISVPGIPRAILDAQPVISVKNVNDAAERVAGFLRGGNVALVTGAGVSVDSGLRAYRGKDGRYMNPNYKPIFYHELVESSEKGKAFRQRYWLRSFLGYPHVRRTLPNTTHFAFAALQHTSYITRIITQNVDGLHQKALQLGDPSTWNSSRINDEILELHGSIHSVHCSKGHVVPRIEFQEWLTTSNLSWHRFANDIARTGQKLRTNPDGDVDIEQLGVSYEDFVVPDCPACLLVGHRNSVQKPGFVFFGESIPEAVKERALRCVEDCDRLLLAGTTLATYSAFRLLKYALELGKPVVLLNVGPTRADGLPGIEKIDVPTGAILPTIARAVIGRPAEEDPVIREMIRSGIVKPPLDDS